MYDLIRKLSGLDQQGSERKRLSQKINNYDKMQRSNASISADTYSLTLLQPLLVGYPFLTFTGASIRPFALISILNDIAMNKRSRIIEFGAGISSVLIGRLINKNRLNAKLISVEHNENWTKLLMEVLKNEGLDQSVRIIWAPLKECDLALDTNKWYDREILDKEVSEDKFDLAIIDGPSSWKVSELKARYPALPYIFDRLLENCSVYLDDANRTGEKFVIEEWEKKFSIKFQINSANLAQFSKGKPFLTSPLAYF